MLLSHDEPAPVNGVSTSGDTPLTLACWKGRSGAVKQLLAANADTERQTGGKGNTALVLVRRLGSNRGSLVTLFFRQCRRAAVFSANADAILSITAFSASASAVLTRPVDHCLGRRPPRVTLTALPSSSRTSPRSTSTRNATQETRRSLFRRGPYTPSRFERVGLVGRFGLVGLFCASLASLPLWPLCLFTAAVATTHSRLFDARCGRGMPRWCRCCSRQTARRTTRPKRVPDLDRRPS